MRNQRDYSTISLTDLFSRDKIVRFRYHFSAVFDRKTVFKPKTFNFVIFFIFGIMSFIFALLIGAFSAAISSMFLESEETINSINESVIIISNIILVLLSLYSSTIICFPTSGANLFELRAKRVLIDTFTQEDYDLVEKYVPDELTNWFEAVIDYSDNNNYRAKEFATNILTIARKRKEEEDNLIQEITTNKWEEKAKKSEILLELENKGYD